MTDAFTRWLPFVEAGAEPPVELWSELRRMLEEALKARGLLARPPSWMGADFEAFSRWDHGALEALTWECYASRVLGRLGALRRNLEQGWAVDALVHRAVDQFVSECQAEHDPIGREVYEKLSRALALAGIGDAPRGGWRNHHQVSIGAGAVPLGSEDLEARLSAVPAWDHAARGCAFGERGACDVLAGALAGLGDVRVGFGVLDKALDRAVRRHGWSLVAHAEGEEVADERSEEARLRWDSEHDLASLGKRVAERIRTLDVQRRTRDGLTRLWAALCEDAMTDDAPRAFSELAARTGIPKSTVGDYFGLLRGLVEAELRTETASATLRSGGGGD